MHDKLQPIQFLGQTVLNNKKMINKFLDYYETHEYCSINVIYHFLSKELKINVGIITRCIRLQNDINIVDIIEDKTK